VANGGSEELDQHGQGADELDSPEVTEQDAQGDDLRGYDEHLGELIQRGTQAGYAEQTQTLRRVRKALKGTRQQIAAAEERGRQRALTEFQAGNEQAVDALRAEVRAELQVANTRERSFARLGLGPDNPARQLFNDVPAGADHAVYERQAALLRAAGVTWDADPVVRQIGQQQVAQWQQAAQHNGGAVPLDPAAGVPAAVQEQVIRSQVEAMVAGQAGGEVISAQSPLERDIEAAQRNPDLMMDEGARQRLADRFNADLDAVSRAQRGNWG